MTLLLKNGRVIDPSQNLDQVGDLLIDEGHIGAFGEKLSSAEAETIDVSGLVVCPGLVDLHTHLREPGFEQKETISTGAKAGVAGGYTTLCCMPNTRPAIDNKSVVTFIKQRGKETDLSSVLPIGSLTKGMKGEELSEIGELVESGVVALSDDGFPIQNAGLMRRAMEYASMFNLPVITHCEDKSLTEGGSMNEGYTASLLGIGGMPNAAEEVMVYRNINLAQLTGCRLHIAHVSTAGSVEIIRNAKKQGIRVTAEVCPQHLAATDDACKTYDTFAKVNPPLRTQNDIDALIEGLKDGTLDCIATDHAPHAQEEKEVEFDKAPFGISMLETSLPLTVSCLLKTNQFTLMDIIRLMSTHPAEIAGISAGSLKTGAPADVLVFNPAAEKAVNSKKFFSMGKNTPFNGAMLTGWPVLTFVAGREVYREAELFSH